MNESELKDLLESYNQKVEEARLLNLQSWVLNLQCFETLQFQKAKSRLKSLMTFKIVMVFLGVLWIMFLGYLLYHSLEWSKIFFVISVGAIIVFNMVAIIVYIQHTVLIRRVNNSENVMDTQKKIARMQMSTLRITRILFLQAPFYCTFWWSMSMISEAPLSFWLISFPICLLFAFASLWLYRNISLKNANKKWFKILFNSSEWTNLIEAESYLNEIENYKRNV